MAEFAEADEQLDGSRDVEWRADNREIPGGAKELFVEEGDSGHETRGNRRVPAADESEGTLSPSRMMLPS